MPDAGGNIKGIATTGKAGETIEKVFGSKRESDPHCGYAPKNCPYGDACADCRPPKCGPSSL